MTTTAIKLPGLQDGLTLTVDVLDLPALSLLQSVSLTRVGKSYNGDVTAAADGQCLFEIYSGSALLQTRIRTIRDTAGPFLIATEFETLAHNGLGEYPVVITITDGTDPLAGVSVRVTASGFVVTLVTDENGVAKFALNNGDYDVTLTKDGYTSSVDSLTVAGSTPTTYAMTIRTVTPPTSPLLATGSGIVYDEANQPEPDVPVSIKLVTGDGSAGSFLDTKTRTTTSDEDGFFEFEDLRRGCEYKVWRGEAESTEVAEGFTSRGSGETGGVTFTVPLDEDDFLIPQVIGLDAEVEEP